jgi:protein O-GlcNAc transferase
VDFDGIPTVYRMFSEVLNRAIQHHRSGELRQAELLYEQVIAQSPDNAEAHNNLAVILRQKGNLKAARVYYQKAIALQPDYVEAHYNLANFYQFAEDYISAQIHYQKVIDLAPQHAEAHCNLATCWLNLGNPAVAIAHYQQSISLNPALPQAHYNLGNAFQKIGENQAAIGAYREAIRLQPQYVDALLNLAKSLEAQSEFREAAEIYAQVVTIDPACGDAYVGLGDYYNTQRNLPQAAKWYEQALRLNPQSAKLCLSLGENYHNQNQLSQAQSYFQRALTIEPDCASAQWQGQLMLPILYQDQAAVGRSRQQFCRNLNALIAQTDLTDLDAQERALAGLAHHVNFYLGYQGCNDRGLQSKYGNFVHRILAANYPQWVQPRPMPTLAVGEKIRVGFLSSHLHGINFARWAIDWIKHLNPHEFAVYSYHVGTTVDQFTEQFATLSYAFYHLPDQFEVCCEQVIADNLHILIFPALGGSPENTEFAGLRLAPVQCMSWGHPITSGLPTIDYYLSSELMEPQNGQQHYRETLIRLPNIGLCYPKPKPSDNLKTRAEFGLRDAAIVYLCCQSPYKYQPQFDCLLPQIAQQVPNAQFVFVGRDFAQPDSLLHQRLAIAFRQHNLNYQDFCVVLSELPHAEFRRLNHLSDVFLDSLAWSGGNSTLEAIADGLPVVTCPGEFMRGRHSAAILQMLGVTETIGDSPETYVEIAVRLGLAPAYRQQLSQKIMAAHDKLYGDRACIAALEAFFKQVVTERSQPIASTRLDLSHDFPKIPAVPADQPRPFWSVVIPTYDRPEWLAHCLTSVLAQAPGPEEMQILVMDDASPTDLAPIIDRISQGRAQYYRSPQNLNQPGIFNLGLQMAVGEWIHLLHDDDWVLPGFYQKMQQALENQPAGIGAACCRYAMTDAVGNWQGVSPSLHPVAGILPRWLHTIGTQNPLNPPAVVVRRSVYETLGGYHPDLGFTSDWEMCKRIATNYRWWYLPETLVCYRRHGESATEYFAQTQQQQAQILRAIEISKSYLPANLREILTDRAKQNYGLDGAQTFQP